MAQARTNPWLVLLVLTTGFFMILLDTTIVNVAIPAMSTGLNATLEHDLSRPDGTPRKLMSNAKLAAMGWSPSISLPEGLKSTYEWFLAHRA